MDELVEKIIYENFSDLIKEYNPNILLCGLLKASKIYLFNQYNLKIDINDKESLKELLEFVLSDYGNIYAFGDNIELNIETVNSMFEIVLKNNDLFDKFLDLIGFNQEFISNLIRNNKEYFIKYINSLKTFNDIRSYDLKKNKDFINLILDLDRVDLLTNIDDYDLDILKRIGNSKSINLIWEYEGSVRLKQKLFEIKDNLTELEFINLISLFKDENIYDGDKRYSNTLEQFISENIDFLFDCVIKTNIIPKSLIVSSSFRDECIKRNRIDLAVKCLLPNNLLDNQELLNKYAKELNIDIKEFYKRYKWVMEYYNKNNNIFNTLICEFLNNFDFNEDHFERFINDIFMELDILKLNKNELKVFKKIINLYNYEEYDISLLVNNIINNISEYNELINNIDIDSINKDDLINLIKIIQNKNYFNIKNINDLRNYYSIKKNNTKNEDINIYKNNLLMLIFNINLDEAKYINYKYCYNEKDINILKELEISELPSYIYNYLLLINNIVENNSINELDTIFNSIKDNKIYNKEIPLELFLRSEYTKLYSESMYKIEERNNIYGPVDNVMTSTTYNDKKIDICVPRVNFNFFIHCVGTCSLKEDVIDSNYRVDWLDRPWLQDHFVACSYINQEGIFSLRSGGSVILGFDHLEGGSLLAMGNTDIDSTGSWSRSYRGPREVQEGNRQRAKFYIPSQLLKTINEGYNEMVVERRDCSLEHETFKRKPDYIIMPVDSLNKNKLMRLDTLFNRFLSFVSEEDKNNLRESKHEGIVKRVLKKYIDVIVFNANKNNISPEELLNMYVELFMASRLYEDSLKAASEFNIPIVAIDKSYYFKRFLNQTSYDEETKKKIFDLYIRSNNDKKSDIFNCINTNGDISQFFMEQVKNITI